MIFSAKIVEAFEDGGVITVHFDEEEETYLQLQGNESSQVYMELGDQGCGGFNVFQSIELWRNKIQINDITESPAREIAQEIQVLFQIDDDAYFNLKMMIHKIFRDYPAKLIQHG